MNSGAIANPSIINEAAKKYGSQCVVLSLDVKRVNGKFELFAKGGRVPTGIDAIEWAHMGQEEGAGELVVNSIDTDGVKKGYELKLTKLVSDAVNIPVIASGGAGSMEDFYDAFTKAGASAGLAASLFHYKEIEIKDLKEYLKEKGVSVRL